MEASGDMVQCGGWRECEVWGSKEKSGGDEVLVYWWDKVGTVRVGKRHLAGKARKGAT